MHSFMCWTAGVPSRKELPLKLLITMRYLATGDIHTSLCYCSNLVADNQTEVVAYQAQPLLQPAQGNMPKNVPNYAHKAQYIHTLVHFYLSKYFETYILNEVLLTC